MPFLRNGCRFLCCLLTAKKVVPIFGQKKEHPRKKGGGNPSQNPAAVTQNIGDTFYGKTQVKLCYWFGDTFHTSAQAKVCWGDRLCSGSLPSGQHLRAWRAKPSASTSVGGRSREWRRRDVCMLSAHSTLQIAGAAAERCTCALNVVLRRVLYTVAVLCRDGGRRGIWSIRR